MAGEAAYNQAALKKNLDQAYKSVAKAVDAFSEGAAKRLEGIAADIKTELIAELSKSGSGATYYRGGESHQASRAGEPPAPWSGTLRDSVSVTVTNEKGVVGLQAGSDTEYATMLEFGTSKMMPRPWLSTVMSRKLAEITQQIAEGGTSAQRSQLGGFGGKIDLGE